MIRASFGWAGKNSVCCVDGQMTSNGYQEVQKNHLVDFGNSIGGPDPIFREDNGPVHRSKANATRFKPQKNNVLPGSSLSHDLN